MKFHQFYFELFHQFYFTLFNICREKMVKRINQEEKPTIVLYSEKNREFVETVISNQKETENLNRKCRVTTVGYVQQMNRMIGMDKLHVDSALDMIMPLLERGMSQNKPFSVVMDIDRKNPRIEEIGYWAACNNGEVTVAPDLKALMEKYNNP